MADRKSLNVIYPEWDERYNKIGVSALELYMRQHQICYLTHEIVGDEVKLYCTDGDQRALTAALLNPTFECAQCLANFTTKVIKDAIKRD